MSPQEYDRAAQAAARDRARREDQKTRFLDSTRNAFTPRRPAATAEGRYTTNTNLP